eukprot:2051669-Pyramimonas_sp.AAC.1
MVVMVTMTIINLIARHCIVGDGNMSALLLAASVPQFVTTTSHDQYRRPVQGRARCSLASLAR